MKKFALIALVVSFMFVGYAEAQQGGSSNTVKPFIDQRIVGTWVDKDDDEWVFKSNGSGEENVYHFTFFQNKIVIRGLFEGSKGTVICDYVFSADGKTLFLFTNKGVLSDIWLTKKN